MATLKKLTEKENKSFSLRPADLHTIQNLAKWLDKNKTKYWIDSGTLLGLVREGKLWFGFPDDVDISLDGSTLCEEKLKKNLTENFERCSFIYYKGNLLKCTIFTKYNLKIDLDIFQRCSEYYWAIQKLTPKYYNLIPKFIRKIKFNLQSRKNNKPSITNKIYEGDTFKTGTWILPMWMIGSTQIDRESGLSIPTFKEHYLHYRYGNWKLKIDDWNFQFDDGGLSRMNPEIIEKIIET